MTAETKRKTLKSGKTITFTYYHCTASPARVPCVERRYVREEVLTERIARMLDRVAIPERMLDIAFEIVRASVPELVEERALTVDRESATVDELRAQLDRLNRTYVTAMISEDEHREMRVELQNRITRAKARAAEESQTGDEVAGLQERVRAFVDVGERFRAAEPDQKRRILGLGPGI